MKLLTQLFNPLQRAATAFFRHDLALRRTERGVHIVLEQRGGPPPKPSREELDRRRQNEELVLMRSQLAELLASLPESRSTMRHLVFVEHALGKKGIRALHKLPIDVLQPALTQLEGLVTNWSPEGLANLRSKMAVAIIERERMGPDAEGDAYRTSQMLESDMTGAAALPEVDVEIEIDENDALAAAYAALGHSAPLGADGADSLEVSGELSSPSAKSALRDAARGGEGAGSIRLRELQS
jgi:hypothetical protein